MEKTIQIIEDRRGLQFKSSFFALIVVSMVIISTGVIISSWNIIYNSGLTYDLGEYDKLNSVTSQVSDQESRLNPESPETGTDFESSTFRAAFGIVKNILTPFRVVFGDGGMLDSVTSRFGLPDYIRQGIVLMIIVAFIFAIVAIIFRIPGGTT